MYIEQLYCLNYLTMVMVFAFLATLFPCQLIIVFDVLVGNHVGIEFTIVFLIVRRLDGQDNL